MYYLYIKCDHGVGVFIQEQIASLIYTEVANNDFAQANVILGGDFGRSICENVRRIDIYILDGVYSQLPFAKLRNANLID